MELLTRDPVDLITRHLDPIDIVRWSLADRRKGRWLKPLFWKRLTEKIDGTLRAYFASVKPLEGRTKFVCDGSYDDFVKAMIAAGGVISGSFILQMISGKHYEGSDIDIYSGVSSCELWLQMNSRIEANDIQVALWPRHDDKWAGNRYDHSEIILIREYTIEANPLLSFKKFQTITLGRSPRTYIKEIFDFSVLRNLFWYDADGPHVEVEDLPGIVNNVIKFDQDDYFKRLPNANAKKVAKRVEKYKARGFTFI